MIKSLKVAALLVLCSAFMTNAQSLKFGHINSTDLLSMMPEIKVADSTLQSFGKSLENQLKTMTNEYQSKIADYRANEATMAEPVKQARAQEIGDLEQRIQEFQDSAQQSIQKKKEELYSPVVKKAEDAIKAVAEEKKYSYIFDTSVGVVLFAQESDDIMPAVKGKLGLK